MLPLITLPVEGSYTIRLMFENESRLPIRYVPAGDGRSIDGLYFQLSKGADVFYPLRIEEVALIAKEIKVLPPGGTLSYAVDIRETFGSLKPGRYLLGATKRRGPSDFELSQFELDQALAWIEIGTGNGEFRGDEPKGRR
jgi:hypothetical protein